MDFRKFFHYVSYLQYPLMLLALYFAFKPYFFGFDQLKEKPELVFENLNSLLIFMGLAVSFSSLQDTTKTQNKFSEKIWRSPKKGKIMIGVISAMIIYFLFLGLTGYYFKENGPLKDLSMGIIVFALGMFGFLKTAIEMFENHRLDKNEQ